MKVRIMIAGNEMRFIEFEQPIIEVMVEDVSDHSGTRYSGRGQTLEEAIAHLVAMFSPPFDPFEKNQDDLDDLDNHPF